MKESIIDLTDRTDISKFLTHLTRNTRDATAKENLISILNDKRKMHQVIAVCLTKNYLSYQKNTKRNLV